MQPTRLLRLAGFTDATSWTNTLIALTLLAKISRFSTTCSAIPVTKPVRWFYPCGGSKTMETLGESDPPTPPPQSDSANNKEQMASTFHTLSVRANKLKRRVRDLKNLYVEKRFRDESIVHDLEQMGLHLEGMPTVYQTTISSVSNTEVVPTVHSAFENLARVAVFLDQARIGETLAINESTSFERDFQRIEDHQEDGLYWILCALRQVIETTGTKVSADVVSRIMSMRVTEVDRNSMRHTRDFIVLRDFERILERLSIEFSSLRKLHAS